MSLVFGGLTFPLDPAEPIPQPFADNALPYLKDAINHYVGAAFAEAMKGKIGGQAATLACQETGVSNPDLQASKLTVRTPYLALWAEDGQVSERTMRWDQNETKYALEYILPPLPFFTVQDVATPLLLAVQKLLIGLMKAGGDSAHNGGARVWEQAGIASVRMGRWQVVAETMGEDLRTTQAFPMLLAEVFVVEQEGYPDGPALDRIDTSINHVSSDGDFPDVVQFRTKPNPLVGRRASVRARRSHMKTLRFLAAEGDHSFSPARARIGQMQPIGKTRHGDGSFTVNAEPAEVTVSGDYESEDITFLRGEVQDGRLRIADKATADVFGVAFDAIKTFAIPPPALPEEASVPSEDAPSKDGAAKRKGQ